MDTRDATDSTTPILTRRQLLRGASVGVGLYAVGSPPVRAVLGTRSANAATPGAAEPDGVGSDQVGRGAGLHGTIRGRSRVGASVVAAGNTLRFDPSRNTTLEVRGNLVVRGRLVMRPQPGVRHILRFVDVDESAFVGGGLDPLDTDVGLWVMGNGRLDIKGTKKQAWNRLGDHPTWRRQDDLVVAPVARGDFTPRRFRKGQSRPEGWAPTCRGAQPHAQRAHRGNPGRPSTHLHPFEQAAVDQVCGAALPRSSPSPAPTTTESVLGRYGLHFHHCHGGSSGSVVEGVVVRDCGGHSFVPHMSDGIRNSRLHRVQRVRRRLLVGSREVTNDLVIDRCVAASVHLDPEYPWPPHGRIPAGARAGG